VDMWQGLGITLSAKKTRLKGGKVEIGVSEWCLWREMTYEGSADRCKKRLRFDGFEENLRVYDADYVLSGLILGSGRN
jgi:hypothetical protein